MERTEEVTRRQSAQSRSSGRSVALRPDPEGCHPTQLAHLRRLRGFTQGTLETATGLPRRHISNLETGIAKRMEWPTARRLAIPLAGEDATIADIDTVVKELVVFVPEEATVD